MSGTGLAVVGAAVLLVAAVAWWLRAHDGAVRTPPPAEEADVRTLSVFERLGVRAGAGSTVHPTE